MKPNRTVAHRGRWIAAFTLVEMLVVMAIIGILAGMILPALSRAREHGRRANCISNLDQISKSMAMYCNANEDYLPSWPNYGSELATARPSGVPGQPYLTYGEDPANPTGSHQGGSRNMVIAYGDAHQNGGGACTGGSGCPLVAGQQNLAPVGLGIMVARGDLADARVLNCPSMRGGASTYYNQAEYRYQSDAFQIMGVRDKHFLDCDATGLFHAAAGNFGVVGLLSSYSYRNHPWMAVAGGSLMPNADGSWNIPSTKPQLTVHLMNPPFKTRRVLGNRAFAADSFDYGPAGTGFTDDGGLARAHHRDGYNVVYGDGHAKWYEDTDEVIRKWPANRWADPAHPQTDNLTISSASSQGVWNLFDRTNQIDITD